MKTFVQETHPNEFAKMLGELFSGIVTEPVKPDIFTEQMFELKELKTAIRRAKLAKAADETGLTAELLRHMPDDICNDLLLMFNHMLFSGEVPAAWRKTLFKMLPKTLKPRTTTDFRPIASIRLFYKIFAYMILGRIEDTLETSQPEEQHGFRSKRRIEEHLLTFNVILDKTLEMDQPLWIISLDLSKAFDRGKRWAIMAYHKTWFGSSKCFIISNVGQLLDQWKTASNLTLQLACDKGAFSAHVCFVPSLNGHCPNGGHNLMVLATIFKTEGFRYWICALLMISLILQNLMRKSVIY